MNERLEIIRSGYKRSGKVGRIEKGAEGRMMRKTYSTYSPKMIANVTGPDAPKIECCTSTANASRMTFTFDHSTLEPSGQQHSCCGTNSTSSSPVGC